MDDDDTSTSGTTRGPGKPPPPGASGPAEDAEPEKVGYGRPPKATRFKPGQSGNPRDAAKGARNLRTYLREELETRVTVGKDGRQQKLPKVHLIAKQLVNAAAGGDLKSIECLVSLSISCSRRGSKAKWSGRCRKKTRRRFATTSNRST